MADKAEKQAETPSEKPSGKREYRMDELARLAGITVRTLRFYRERGLIPAAPAAKAASPGTTTTTWPGCTP
ncbi:hypothetical protein SGLAM104S_04389 [Streptomyces glaucescens]